MSTPLRVCVVMPAFSESSVIGDVVSDAVKAFKNSPYHAEIVVVNDASKDDTGNSIEDVPLQGYRIVTPTAY